MSTNFLVWDEIKDNLMGDIAYLASSWRINGNQAGIAPVDVYNKLFYQTSIFCAAFAKSLSDRGLTVSDSVFAELVAVFNQVAISSSSDVGRISYIIGNVAPSGYLKANGALVSREAYPNLWTYAQACGSIFTDAVWSANRQGGFSTGDLSTTFRLPDLRGEFIRSFDDGRGVDNGRVAGSFQDFATQDHTHANVLNWVTMYITTGSTAKSEPYDYGTSGGMASGNIGTETRPRNLALMACIKY